MEHLSKEFWDQRYRDGETGWDAGSITRPLKEYVDQLESKDLRILIPGCGNGHEAEYLWQQGFRHVHVLDVSELPLKNLCERLPDFPVSQIHQTDFFQHAGSYDLVLEQTLFCAIDPSLRGAYAKKVAELLVPGGKYVGVLFNFPLESGPPYGGDAGEYNSHFSPWFAQLLFQECHNSIPPRAGRELFARLKKA